jgi:hypothetical protein
LGKIIERKKNPPPEIQAEGVENPPGSLKIHLVAIDVADKLAADFAIGFVDDRLYRFVFRQHLGGPMTLPARMRRC